MLKSLEVFGFKSFADRTTFAFAPGITCVVGPNGSGKSNVVDAMKWLLGDQSPKSLRGKAMADVIFNGSRSRKPSGFAEATLSFDNTQQILATPLEEVRITRRLYQGGDSEYLINGETSRLKDIRDLFMGTGAATSAYSIIEQGRVGQVLQGNPSTRRVLFEEAAGISRFKSRRIDAERKLDRVSQNLLRLTDIVDEVETQLHACRNQAGKAARYRELTRGYDALRLGLAADDARILFTRLQEISGQTSEAQEALSKTQKAQADLEAEREELRSRFRSADESLQDTEAKLSTLMQQRSSVQTSLHHQSERAREISGEADLLRKQRVELKRRVHDIDEEIAAETQRREDVQSEMDQKVADQEAAAAQLRELTESIEQRREEQAEQRRALVELQRQQATAESHLKHLNSRRETILAARERLFNEREAADVEVERIGETVAEATEVYQAAADRHSEHKRRIDGIQKRRQELEHQLSTINARQALDREQRSAWEARLGLLEDMEQRQLGLSLGVQEILNRARKSHLSPWKHVLGILVDFFECDFEDAALIEIALNGGSQMIVVDHLPPFLEYLERHSTQFEGRLGFVELPRQFQERNPQELDRLHDFEQQYSEQDGLLARADRLVRCDDQFRPLIEQLLRSTWIVDGLTTARRLLLNAPTGSQFLTQQGDLLTPDGIVHTGTIQAEGSVVSRRSEILRIKHELLELTRHIERLDRKTEELGEVLLRLDEELANAQTWMESQTAELSELRQQVQSRQNELDLAVRERSRIDSDHTSVESQLESVQQEQSDQHQELEQIAEQLESLSSQIDQFDRDMQQARQHEQEIAAQHSHFKVELSKTHERLASIDAVLTRLNKDRQLRQAQYEEAISRLENAQQKEKRLELQILTAQSRLAEYYLIGEQLQVDVQRSRRQRNEIQVRRDRSNEQLRQLTEKRREEDERVQDLRIELRDVETELQVLRDKLFEEYQLGVQQIIDLGFSALKPFEAMRRDEEIEAIDYPRPEVQATAQEENADGEEDETEPVEATPVDSIEDLSQLDVESTPWPWLESEHDFAESRDTIEREVQRLRKKIKSLGAVDPSSLQGLDELESRYRHLSTQLQDLKHAQSTLEDIIRRINTESKRIFMESFTAIRAQFQDLFRQLFGGGEGDVIMEDESDPLECGIEIVARPPGKELRSISLLSGGEKTMTAVGLLLAIFKSRPSPFCILDECDAALDEANIDRFAGVIKQFRDKTQFIVITHRKRTMTAADRIFGVTMEEAGVSKKLTVRFEDVGENGEISKPDQKEAA